MITVRFLCTEMRVESTNKNGARLKRASKLKAHQGFQTVAELKTEEEHETTQARAERVTGFGRMGCSIKTHIQTYNHSHTDTHT